MKSLRAMMMMCYCAPFIKLVSVVTQKKNIPLQKKYNNLLCYFDVFFLYSAGCSRQYNQVYTRKLIQKKMFVYFNFYDTFFIVFT